MLNTMQNLPQIDLMGILRNLSNSKNPVEIMQGLLKDYPQLQFIIQSFAGNSNQMAMLDQFFGNIPAYQQIKKDIQGKSQEEIMQYLTNRYQEQGINFSNLIQNGNKAIQYLKQSGLIK